MQKKFHFIDSSKKVVINELLESKKNFPNFKNIFVLLCKKEVINYPDLVKNFLWYAISYKNFLYIYENGDYRVHILEKRKPTTEDIKSYILEIE